MSLYVQPDYVLQNYTNDFITIDWPRSVIYIPKDELTLVQTTPTEIRNLDLNWFRLQLKALEDTFEGMTWIKTHNHNTEVLLGGLTYARVIEILDPYTITFEDGNYAVNLVGANSNVGDKINVNQVSVRSANSAGLISSPAIEFASFNGGVLIDVENGVNGTAFPRGTEQMPVNNIYDAILISNFRGLKTFYLNSDITINGGSPLSNFFMVGKSHITTRVLMEPNAIIDNLTIEECELSGTMDNYSIIRNCVVKNIFHMNGDIVTSSLNGTIELGGGKDTYFNNCTQLDVDISPVIDMGGSGQNLILLNYSGQLKIINLSNTNTINIGLTYGKIILDSTSVIAGFINLYGVGELTDQHGNRILSGVWNNGVVVSNGLINRYMISESLELSSFVYVDTYNGIPGTTFPIGTKRTPSNNIEDAVLICNDLGLKDIFFLSDYTFGSNVNMDGFGLTGSGYSDTTLTFMSGALTPHCHVHNLTVTGNLSGVSSIYDSLIIDLGVLSSSDDITITHTLIDGVISLTPNYSGTLTFIDCYSNIPGSLTPTIDFGNSTAQVQFRNYTGGIQFRNITQGNLVSVDLISGNFKLEDNNTNGTIVARGVGKMVESSTGEHIPSGIWNGGVMVFNDIMSQGTVSQAVWDEPISKHLIGGSTGQSIGLTQFGGVVSFKQNSIYTGTSFPIGTKSFPVNNLTDAKQILLNNSFNTINIIDEVVFYSGQSIDNLKIISENISTIEIQTGVTTSHTIFEQINIKGHLNGYTTLKSCNIDASGLNNFYGFMDEIIFNGPIKVSSDNTKDAVILDSFTGSIDVPLVFDCNGDGCKISLRGFTGPFLFRNKTGATKPIFVDLYSGRLGFDSSITAGNITVRGVGNIYLNQSTNTTFDLQGLISQPTISQAVWDENLTNHIMNGSTGQALSFVGYNNNILIDTVNGVSGTNYPIGTDKTPVNNLTDAIILKNNYGLFFINVSGYLQSTENLNNISIQGNIGWFDDVFDLNGFFYDDTNFKHIRLTGEMLGNLHLVDCYIQNISNLNCEIISGRISGINTVAHGGRFSGSGLIVETDFTVIDLQNQPCTVSLDVDSGIITFINAVDGCLIELNLRGGEIVLDPSCIGGDFYAEGYGTLYNESNMNITENHLIALDTIPGPIWNTQLSEHTIGGSAGKVLSTASSGGVDYSLLSQAVWNEYLTEHTTNDTAAFIMKQIATLADELHKIQGLSLGNPMNVTPKSRASGGIVLDITGDGKTTTIVTRK